MNNFMIKKIKFMIKFIIIKEKRFIITSKSFSRFNNNKKVNNIIKNIKIFKNIFFKNFKKIEKKDYLILLIKFSRLIRIRDTSLVLCRIENLDRG